MAAKHVQGKIVQSLRAKLGHLVNNLNNLKHLLINHQKEYKVKKKLIRKYEIELFDFKRDTSRCAFKC